MDALFGGKFLGIEWSAWKVIGWIGNAVFFSRFIVQWYATERHKQVVVPVIFWWLSLLGSFLLFAYALFYKKDSVFIFAYAFAWIPYVQPNHPPSAYCRASDLPKMWGRLSARSKLLRSLRVQGTRISARLP